MANLSEVVSAAVAKAIEPDGSGLPEGFDAAAFEAAAADLREHLSLVTRTLAAQPVAGSRGMRASDPPGQGVRIEVVVGPEVADRILDHVAEHYFPHYAVIAFVADVAVVRGEKYV